MAKKKNGVNKSEEIRQLLKANPSIGAKEIVSTLGGKGIQVSQGLVHFVKGHLKGRKGRKKKTEKVVAKVAAATGNDDALTTVLKVNQLASEVGGLKKLKALVDAMST
jgi:hypothetical protein